MIFMDVKHCYNRPPFAGHLVVKNGLLPDGRQAFKEIKDPMSKSCQVDIRAFNPGCRGCKWRDTIDPRDNDSVVKV